MLPIEVQLVDYETGTFRSDHIFIYLQFVAVWNDCNVKVWWCYRTVFTYWKVNLIDAMKMRSSIKKCGRSHV